MRKTIWLPLLLLLVLRRKPYAQTSPAPLPFTNKPLSNNVYAARDDPKGDAGSNTAFEIGDDGVAVIDTFVNPAAAKQLLARKFRSSPSCPVKFVVNTHYHLDHVAGNSVFAETGAIIIGHRNIRGWIHTENLKFFGKDIKPEQKAMVEGLVAPNLIYDSVIELFLGSRRIVVRYYSGHTGGDSVVRFRTRKSCSAAIFPGERRHRRI